MDDARERLRRRLEGAGAAIPDELIDVIAVMAGPMLNAHERLVDLDFADVEPFSPARLVYDAQ